RPVRVREVVGRRRDGRDPRARRRAVCGHRSRLAHLVEVPRLDQASLDRVYLANLAAVVENYRKAGVKRFVFAGAVAGRDEVAAVEAAVGVTLRTVRLSAPPDVIEERLRSDPVTSRLEDLETVRRWIEDGAGLDVGDLVVTNDGRPLQDTAREILYWLGWLPGR